MRSINCQITVENHKGQWISKCLFGVFKFFQKTYENKSTWGIIVKLNCFVRFLEELMIPKSLLEINWPFMIILNKNARKFFKQYWQLFIWFLLFERNLFFFFILALWNGLWNYWFLITVHTSKLLLCTIKRDYKWSVTTRCD